jgi:hypothetical protein
VGLRLQPLTKADRLALARADVRITGNSGALLVAAPRGADFQRRDVLLGPCFEKTVKLYDELVAETAKLRPTQHWCYRVFRKQGLTIVAGGA